MPFHTITIFTLAYLLPLSLAHLPQQKTPFKLYILYNKSIADAQPSFLLKEAILFALLCFIEVWFWSSSAHSSRLLLWHWTNLINGLAQDCSNPSALVMELLQYWTKPSIWLSYYQWSNPAGYSKYIYLNIVAFWFKFDCFVPKEGLINNIWQNCFR